MKRYIKSAVSNINSEDSDVKDELASDPNTSAFMLKQLALDDSRFIRKAVAENPSTPTEVLKLLVNDKYARVRYAVACNPNATAEILSALINDSDETIRNAITLSPNVTDSILMDLLKNDNKDDDNAFIVARSEKASPETLTYLFNNADHNDTHIMRRLARNTNTPVEILQELANFDTSYVSLPAQHRLENLK